MLAMRLVILIDSNSTPIDSVVKTVLDCVFSSKWYDAGARSDTASLFFHAASLYWW